MRCRETHSDLKPCPFCGGEIQCTTGFNGLTFFKCKRCTAVMSFNLDYYNTKPKKAIEAFNRRTDNG